MSESLLPEQKARREIDNYLRKAGWSIVSREEYSPGISAAAIEEGILGGHLEADYLLFLEGKAIGVLEAKSESVALDDVVARQAENYTHKLLPMYQYWKDPLPLIYLSNGKELLFKNTQIPGSSYQRLDAMHTPRDMVKLAGIQSYFAGLPTLEPKGLRDCQYEAITNLEASFRNSQNKALIVLATGAGKTFTACMATYRFLAYTPARRVLFLVDRNNLGTQAEGAFGEFKLTQTGDSFSTIYTTERIRSNKISAGTNVAICTIQRLFAVITGQELEDGDDDELPTESEDLPDVELTGKLHLPPDFFDLIIVDECHRSIYGRWRKVLEYFGGARVIGLTATPSDETMAFFNNNRVMNYTLEKSIVDDINVDQRIYRIRTSATEYGGEVRKGEAYREITTYTGEKRLARAFEPIPYSASDLDRAVINPAQIKLVLETYRDAIYTELYPNREPNFAYIPKTLIFAKSDIHADNIVKILREQVFPGQCPEFVQKITYSSGDSNALIKNFRNDKKFRIAVTVTLVATGTDVKPLEVLIFMRDVNSETLYVQMKGRGVRKIEDEILRAVTPNADTKEVFYLVDAIGVTEHVRHSQAPEPSGGATISLEHLLEQITHGYLPDDNLRLLAGRLARINGKSNDEQRAQFAGLAGMEMKEIASAIYEAFENESLTKHPFENSNQPNALRKALVQPLSLHADARKYLLVLNAGFVKVLQPGHDTLISAGFSFEKAQETVSKFETYIQAHREEEPLRSISDNEVQQPITYDMLEDFRKKLLETDPQFAIGNLWHSHGIVHHHHVISFKNREEQDARTNLIQLVRFSLKMIPELRSLTSMSAQRFELWCGQVQRGALTEAQRSIAKEITAYIACNGFCSKESLRTTVGSSFLIRAKNAFGSMENVEKILLSLSSFMLAA